LVPSAGAFGGAHAEAFVQGLQHATIVAAVLSGAGAVASAVLVDRNHRRRTPVGDQPERLGTPLPVPVG
jgi:hypothetical protein